jgi:hypothetical protein
MKYPGVTLRRIGDKVLEMPAGTSVAASAHAVAGTDPWPIHAREAEEEGRKCNVCHFPQPFAIPAPTELEVTKPAPRQEAQGRARRRSPVSSARSGGRERGCPSTPA